MSFDEMVEMALKPDGNLKLILKGNVEQKENKPIGVVSVVYVTSDVQLAKQKFTQLNGHKNDDEFYMIYSCPVDTYLPDMGHYPSIEISQEDLQN
ncbi:hypothetical protein OZX69_08725 [Lactobacillus sp. ESL0731]|uniref:hypothetical protein n=1 Tax=unclassified Lactobacillus TaxID=2620435 RepID=UPI0023FA4A78|nr:MULTISPECIES: hypothetical protein [unclassified Lactobacillus]WEV51018.1 hypothetical protein OZX63_08720 [Lactobacillus sp. ESL0700]WEV62149.1 hypothetical protein OZX69_08725 [Lactobacillus sp. ESL0731]